MKTRELGEQISRSAVRRYGFAVLIYALIVLMSSIVSSSGVKVNLTIPLVVGLSLVAWFAGRWAGIILVVLLQGTSVVFSTPPPDSTLTFLVVTHISVFALLVFLVILISSRRASRDKVHKQREDLEALNATLEQRVVERTAELEAANRELESFSYSVSHDLRAPLRHINGFSQALLEDYADTLDETGKGYLQELRKATDEMGQLIDDVLKLARLTRTEMVIESVNLSELAHASAKEIQKGDSGRRVDVDIQDGLSASGDKRLLRIMLSNLLGNAWKFTSKSENAEIVFGQEQTDVATVFFVRDNGAGFDMAYADKLFGAFQRLHRTDEFDGTGIGLATVQRVINRHGGRVWAEGEVNKGAVFYFTLPEIKEVENEG